MDDKEKSKKAKRDEKFPGYPSNPPHEDIVHQGKEVHIDNNEGAILEDAEPNKEREKPMLPEEELDDEYVTNIEMDDDWNEENFDEVHTGEDLDVPGGELDDEEEALGQEDEENNYYSLGGPRKDD